MKHRKTSPSKTEGGQSFLEALIAGRKPVSVLLENTEFQKRLKRMCAYFERDPDKAEDLSQDACLRLLKYGDAISQFKAESPEQLFRWLFVVVRHLWLTGRMANGRFQIDDTPIDEMQLESHGPGPEAERLFSEFVEFTKSLPYAHRRAIELHWMGYSSREIARMFSGAGYVYSHVSVSAWISRAYKHFSKGRSVKKAIGF